MIHSHQTETDILARTSSNLLIYWYRLRSFYLQHINVIIYILRIERGLKEQHVVLQSFST
jgi:hypothetical protein